MPLVNLGPQNQQPTIGYNAGLFVADFPANGLLTETAVNNPLNLVEIPQVTDITPEGTEFGDVRETHLKSPNAHHQFGAGWGDPRSVTFTQLYNERNKALLLSLEPRAYSPPAGAPPANRPIPRGGKLANGTVLTQADGPLLGLDLYLWIRQYPDGSKVGFFGFLKSHPDANQNTDDTAMETTATIRVSGKPLFVEA